MKKVKTTDLKRLVEQLDRLEKVIDKNGAELKKLEKRIRGFS